MLSDERNGTFSLLAHLDVSLAASMQIASTSCVIHFRIAVLIASLIHTCVNI